MTDVRLTPVDAPSLKREASALHPPPAWLTVAAAACLVIGIAGFALGLAVAPGRAWGSLLANFLFWTGLCQAGVVVAAVFNISQAWWGRPVQRLVSALSVFLPFSLIVLAALWFGKGHLFEWLGDPHRPAWLGSAAGVFLRDAVVIIGASYLAMRMLLSGLRLDLGARQDEGGPGQALTERVTRNWRGYAVERVAMMRLQRTLSPIVVLWYVLGGSIVVIDLGMSMDTGFRSTMFPVLYWIGCFYATFAVASIFASLWSRVGALEGIFTGTHVRDLGNMLWGASIFYAYVSWSQYFVIWMGNLPNEAYYFALRWRTWPWGLVAWIMLTLAFIAPFLLLFARGLKRRLNALAAIGVLSVIGVLLWDFLTVLPSVPNLGPSTFGAVEVSVTLGFVGAVALPYLWLIRRVPLFPVEDPLFARLLATRGVEV